MNTLLINPSLANFTHNLMISSSGCSIISSEFMRKIPIVWKPSNSRCDLLANHIYVVVLAITYLLPDRDLHREPRFSHSHAAESFLITLQFLLRLQFCELNFTFNIRKSVIRSNIRIYSEYILTHFGSNLKVFATFWLVD